MNTSSYARGGNMFAAMERVKSRVRRMAKAGGRYFFVSVFCVGLGQSVYNCAHFRRLECLSPHEMT